MLDSLEVRIPSTLDTSASVFAFKAVSADRKYSKSFKLERDKTLSIAVSNDTSFIDRSTIVFIQEQNSDGTWQDLTPRVRLSALDPIKNLDVKTLSAAYDPDDASDTTLINSAKICLWCSDLATRKQLHRVATALSRTRLTNFPTGNQTKLAQLIVALGSDCDRCLLTDVLIYASSLIELASIINNYPSWRATQACPQKLQDELKALRSRIRHLAGLELVGALNIAITDVIESRSKAATISESLRQHVSDNLNSAETGCRTYGVVPEDVKPLDVFFHDIYGECALKGHSKTTILYSGNPAFFRAYLPRIFFFMTVFEDFHYHFALLGSADECRRFSEEMLEHWRTTCRIKKHNGADQISISYSEIPSNLPNHISFLASARFYFAKSNLMKFPNALWIQDVDLYPEEDFRPILRAMSPQTDIGISQSSWLGGIFPWKRLMAGNVYLKPTANTASFLDACIQYLNYWLVADGSWMIDQNALAYAATKSKDVKFFDFLAQKMPLRQSTMAGLFESSVGNENPNAYTLG